MNSFDRELGKERLVGAAKVQHYPGVGEKAPTVSRWLQGPISDSRKGDGKGCLSESVWVLHPALHKEGPVQD